MLAIVLLLAIAGTKAAPKAFQTEAVPNGPVADLAGGRVCQADAVPPRAGFSEIVASIEDQSRPTVPVRVTVSTPGGRRLAAGEIGTDRQPPPAPAVAKLDRRVAADQPIEVCLTARGERHRVLLLGATDPRISDAEATFRGQGIGARIFLIYERRGATRFTTVAEIADRSALLRAPWIRPWMTWTVIGLLAVAVPLLLGAALWRG